MIRAIIVDDEKKSREVLKRLLQELNIAVSIVDEAEGVVEGVRLINKTKPQLVFLDVEMLDGTGFNLLERVNEVAFEVIFTTAYDKYAIKAFKYSAIDYLLKPIDLEELENAICKATEAINNKLNSADQVEALLSNIKNGKSKKIAIKGATKVDFITINEIICCKAEDSYTTIYLINDKKITISKPLKHFDEMLFDEDGFFRVDKSSFVNLNFVKSYLKEKDVLILDNDMEVTVSRRRKKEFLDRFETL